MDNTDLEGALKLLSEDEADELQRWLSKEKPPIAVSTAAKLFEIFIQGQTCKQIHKLNPQFDYGAIIHARIRDGWDEKRAEYVAHAYGSIREKVIKAQMDAIEMTANLLSVTAEQNNKKYLKYLQTKDEQELKGSIQIESLKQFKEAVESLQKLTGQDKDATKNPVTNAPANSGERVIEAQAVQADPLQLPSNMDGSTANMFIRRALDKARNKG